MEGKESSSSLRLRFKGKQRIDMKKINNIDDLLITFSKRRSGIYKKASELVTLCGAEVGVVIFSPSGKAFSFGHPSADAVADKFFPNDGAPEPVVRSIVHPIVEAFQQQKVENLNEYHDNLVDCVEDENELRKALAKKMNGVPMVPRRRRRQQRQVVGEEYEEEDEDEEEEEEEKEKPWWEAPLNWLSTKALEKRYKSLQEIHNNISNHIAKDSMADTKGTAKFGANTIAPPPPPPAEGSSLFYGATGSFSTGNGSNQADQLPWTSFPPATPGYGNGKNNAAQH